LISSTAAPKPEGAADATDTPDIGRDGGAEVEAAGDGSGDEERGNGETDTGACVADMG
jgi:hypothetical protein